MKDEIKTGRNVKVIADEGVVMLRKFTHDGNTKVRVSVTRARLKGETHIVYSSAHLPIPQGTKLRKLNVENIK